MLSGGGGEKALPDRFEDSPPTPPPRRRKPAMLETDPRVPLASLWENPVRSLLDEESGAGEIGEEDGKGEPRCCNW